MSLGASIRGLLGAWEKPVAEAYRAIFVDLDAWVDQLRAVRPAAVRILEVGCGEGALTERLSAAYPTASITAIDITPRAGRLFRGDAGRVAFRQMPVGDIARTAPASFDLVVMCDVLHHVPQAERGTFMADIGRTVALGGLFAMKDWARSATPIHWACWASDRFLTGDDVAFASRAEARALLESVFGAACVRDGAFIRPWSNNIGFFVRSSFTTGPSVRSR
jgi:2-polyprenyl-6-hydroxyphenyl methylase/3-demethylubiquinone-9 3-methyltransferase